MKTFNSQIMTSALVTAKEFIKMIQVRQVADGDHVLYNQKIENYGGIPFDPILIDRPMPGMDEVVYQRKCVVLSHRYDDLPSQLMSSISYGFAWYQPPVKLFYDLVLEHLYKFGSGNYIVRLDRRTWMPASPDSFRIFQRGDRYALVCVDATATFATKVERMTEAEALAAYAAKKEDV